MKSDEQNVEHEEEKDRNATPNEIRLLVRYNSSITFFPLLIFLYLIGGAPLFPI
jgi:hypothetical protein